MKTSTLRIISTALISAIIVFILVGISVPKIIRLEKNNADLRNYIKQLEVNINVKDMQIKDLQSELTGAYQEMEYYAIKYHGNALALYELEDRYRVTKSYANQAEFVLVNLGYEFRQVD